MSGGNEAPIDTASSNNCAALKSVWAKGKLPAATPQAAIPQKLSAAAETLR